MTHRLETAYERPPWSETKRKMGYDARGVMEGYSIADIALYAYTHVAHEGGFELDGYPRIRAWLERIAAEPGHVPITA